MKRPRIIIRFWQSIGELSKLGELLDLWFDRMFERICRILQSRHDELTAPLELVELLAFERGVVRLKGEPEELFRRRVKFAFANALDAGSADGFVRIWERLKLGKIDQKERALGAEDWDVILLSVDEDVFAGYAGLLDELIRLYGCTCRRYVADSRSSAGIWYAITVFDCDNSYVEGGERTA